MEITNDDYYHGSINTYCVKIDNGIVRFYNTGYYNNGYKSYDSPNEYTFNEIVYMFTYGLK